MTFDDFKGDWEGHFAGTNQGRLRMRLTPVPAGLVAEAMLDDDAHGTAYLLGTGEIANDELRATLSGRGADASVAFGTVTVIARFAAPGKLSGEWSTTVGTSGTFDAAAPPEPSPATASPAPFSRVGVVRKLIRIPACVVNVDILRRLQAIIRAAADEAAEIHDRKQSAPIRGGRAETVRLYRMSTLVRGAEGEVTITDDPSDLDPGGLPHPLVSVEFEIGANYRLATGNEPYNRILLRLDFTRPPAFDFSNILGTPTPNGSAIEVAGADPLWVSGVFERVRAVLHQGRVKSGWLHGRHTYDVLVLLVGLPLSFSLAVLAGSRVGIPQAVEATLFRLAVVFIVAILTLSLFRLGFSVVRWPLAYVEYAPSPEPMHRRVRLLVAAILFAIATGVLGSALFELLK